MTDPDWDTIRQRVMIRHSKSLEYLHKVEKEEQMVDLDADAHQYRLDEIAELKKENARLTDVVTRMARIYKHLNPENHPGVYFIHGSLGSYDQNGMPEKLLVVPAYGCDFSYVYERTEKTTGPEW